jgi:hypothetical protein
MDHLQIARKFFFIFLIICPAVLALKPGGVQACHRHYNHNGFLHRRENLNLRQRRAKKSQAYYSSWSGTLMFTSTTYSFWGAQLKQAHASLMSRSTAPTNQIYAAVHINPFVTQDQDATERNRIHWNISTNVSPNTASTSAVVESRGFHGLDKSVPTSIPFPEFLWLRGFWLMWRFVSILGYVKRSGKRMTR